MHRSLVRQGSLNVPRAGFRQEDCAMDTLTHWIVMVLKWTTWKGRSLSGDLGGREDLVQPGGEDGESPWRRDGHSLVFMTGAIVRWTHVCNVDARQCWRYLPGSRKARWYERVSINKGFELVCNNNVTDSQDRRLCKLVVYCCPVIETAVPLPDLPRWQP